MAHISNFQKTSTLNQNDTARDMAGRDSEDEHAHIRVERCFPNNRSVDDRICRVDPVTCHACIKIEEIKDAVLIATSIFMMALVIVFIILTFIEGPLWIG
jgi:hypothetical protein